MAIYADEDGYRILNMPEPAWLLDADQNWTRGRKEVRRPLPVRGRPCPRRPTLSELDDEWS